MPIYKRIIRYGERSKPPYSHMEIFFSSLSEAREFDITKFNRTYKLPWIDVSTPRLVTTYPKEFHIVPLKYIEMEVIEND